MPVGEHQRHTIKTVSSTRLLSLAGKAERDDHAAVVRGEFLVRALQFGLVADPRASTPTLGLSAQGSWALPRKTPALATWLASQSTANFAARRLCVRAAACRPAAHKQVRAERLLAAAVRKSAPCVGVIDKELLAGEVSLAHRALQTLLPAAVHLAERASAVSRRAVAPRVLLPQEL